MLQCDCRYSSKIPYPNYGRSPSKKRRCSMILFTSLMFFWVWKIFDTIIHIEIYFYRKEFFNPV